MINQYQGSFEGIIFKLDNIFDCWALGIYKWCKMKTEGHKDKRLNQEDCSMGSMPELIYPGLPKHILRVHIVYT